jgi:predicted amidohydrolase YtcJ
MGAGSYSGAADTASLPDARAAPWERAAVADRAADLVLTGGCVATMDAVRRLASAVAVSDGRIVAVGRDGDVEDLAGARTRRIHLAGRTLLPGFQDAHVHPAMAGLRLLRCALHDLPRTVGTRGVSPPGPV